MSAKVEVNGSGPLPQRPQKNQGDNKNMNNKAPMEGPAEKKPRFNQGGPGQNQNRNQNMNNQNQNQNKGFPNNNKNFGNRKNQPGNQNMNKGNFQNQNQNQNQQKQAPPQAQAVKDEKKDAAVKPGANAGNAGANNPPQQQNQQSNQSQNQQQNPNQNQQNPNQNQQNPNQNQQNPNQNQQQNQQNLQQSQQNMNRPQQHGGFGAEGGMMNRGNRDRGQKRDRNFGDRNFGGGNRDFGGNRENREAGGPRGGGDLPRGPRNDEFFVNQRLRSISGPTHEIEPIQNAEESKFSGRNRLYIGNLAGEISEEDLKELFKPYGEIAEVFCNAEKNFAFLKMDYHVNAERAKRELDGSNRKGRPLRVRFAPNATILRVSNLTPFVSNELLYRSFEVFGPIERAVVNVDDRGKSTGEGIVEFVKKSSANICLRYCNEKCFFLTASLRPCVVEPSEPNEDTDGLPDKSLNKKLNEFNHERSVGPRFADRGSFEHEYGTRWKQLYELFKSKQEALKRELKMEEEKLEAQMEYARYEHETELLRQELRKRESDNERKKMEWEMREKQAEEMRKRDEEQVRRQQGEMQSRMMRQEEEMRRRQQENTLFMQAQQLNSLLDQQEGGFSGNCNNFDGFGGNNPNPFDFRGNNNNSGGGNGSNGPNGPNNQQDFGFEFGGNQNQQGGNDGNRGAQRGGNNAANNNPWERRRRF